MKLFPRKTTSAIFKTLKRGFSEKKVIKLPFQSKKISLIAEKPNQDQDHLSTAQSKISPKVINDLYDSCGHIAVSMVKLCFHKLL